MEKETVLILLLLKPMTKTSQLNDIAIMIYNGGYPVLKISIPFFCHYFDENHMCRAPTGGVRCDQPHAPYSIKVRLLQYQ